ncbi:hypothetical protein BC830DRAFT_1167075 [Chytriomyces sp. MP71]|nr:hypothetical protein BC830DRAFT_1167075 [Chytriomyces sp. MP71]
MTAPRKRLTGVAACAPLGALYGACVNGLFDKVEKGGCAREFEAFKRCLTQVWKHFVGGGGSHGPMLMTFPCRAIQHRKL